MALASRTEVVARGRICSVAAAVAAALTSRWLDLDRMLGVTSGVLHLPTLRLV